MTLTTNDHQIAAIPCAPWCSNGTGHLDQHPRDRYCHSDFLEVANDYGKPEHYTDGTWRMPWLNVYLRREWRETEARIVVHAEEGDNEITLSQAEATALRDALNELLHRC